MQAASKRFDEELFFTTSRSSGAGGQHVNKVESRVSLHFDVDASILLTALEKEQLKKHLGHRITEAGVFQLHVQESRSQLKNKEIAIRRFYQLIAEALLPKKKRKRTKIPEAVKEKRRKLKQAQADKKRNRRPPLID